MLFSRIAAQSLKTASRRGFHASSAANAKVAVLGAAGGIGQPLSLLLKLSPQVDDLACYDIVGTPGIAADLSHVSMILSMILSLCHRVVQTKFSSSDNRNIHIFYY